MQEPTPVRVERRLVVALSIRVYGMGSDGKPFNQTATTLDITRDGARLEGLPAIAEGEIVGVQYRDKKCRYKIVWVGEVGGRREGQVGLQVIPEGGVALWSDILDATPEDLREAPKAFSYGAGK